jgi:hypothetical protein
MDLYPPGAMTSTHTGNPLCVAAALANLDILVKENLAENAAKVGGIMHCKLAGLKTKFSEVIGAHHGMGLVAGLHMVKPGTREPNAPLANAIVRRCVEKGVLMFAPVGFGGFALHSASTRKPLLKGFTCWRNRFRSQSLETDHHFLSTTTTIFCRLRRLFLVDYDDYFLSAPTIISCRLHRRRRDCPGPANKAFLRRQRDDSR